MDHHAPHAVGLRLTITSLLLAGCVFATLALPTPSPAAASASAEATEVPAVQPDGPFPLLAKAEPDECYGGVGAAYFPMTVDGCPSGRSPKVNQAYVWGMTKIGSDLWFGTAPNTVCLVLGEILDRFGITVPVETDAFVCEYGQSGYRASLPDPDALDPRLGDWRPPQLYRYATDTGKLTDVGAGLAGDDLDRLDNTLGFRSAGSLGHTVLLAGPTLSGGIGQEATAINVFAFNAASGRFIDSTTIPAYSDIRRWITVKGHLYTAVGKSGGGGALLRWNGDPDHPGTAANPSKSLFDFEEVGSIPTEGADLAKLKGRIYVTSWPIVGKDTETAGLYQSPEVGERGLPATERPLRELWTVADYETDPLTAGTYLGGAVESFDGQLVWGTMHAPLVPALLHMFAYGASADVVGQTHRASAVFKGKRLESKDPKIRLLYGAKKLPTYDPGTAEFVSEPNNLGQKPKFGRTGFDNPFNLYTWSMAKTNRGLYVGTQDFSYVGAKILPAAIYDEIATTQSDPSIEHGGDLMLFKSLNKPAKPVSRTGVGNTTNYGIRTMIGQPHRLYLGTANPMNLLPTGGWELRRLGGPPG